MPHDKSIWSLTIFHRLHWDHIFVAIAPRFPGRASIMTSDCIKTVTACCCCCSDTTLHMRIQKEHHRQRCVHKKVAEQENFFDYSLTVRLQTCNQGYLGLLDYVESPINQRSKAFLGDTRQEKSEEFIPAQLTDKSFYALEHCLKAMLMSTGCTPTAITKRLEADEHQSELACYDNSRHLSWACGTPDRDCFRV